MEELLHTATEVYGHAIYSAAEYAVEIDPSETAEFRRHLQALQRQLGGAAKPQEWKAIQASFRGELRTYRDSSRGRLNRLREEITAARDAVNLFAETVTASNTDHKVKIKQSLGQLEVMSRSNNAEEIRVGIRQVAGAISNSVEVMQQSHQLAVAQLRDEIRVLHKEVERGRNAHLLDRTTGVWNREKLDSSIAKLAAGRRPFCVLLVHVPNLRLLDRRYSPAAIEASLKALLGRLSGLLDANALLGRWSECCFAALVEIPAAKALVLSRAASEKLTGEYPVQEKGLSQNVPLVAVTGIIDGTAGEDEASFQKKLLQMSEALAGVQTTRSAPAYYKHQ